MSRLNLSPRFVIMAIVAVGAAMVIVKSIAPSPSAGAPPGADGSARLPGDMARQLSAMPQLQEVPTPGPDVTWEDVFQVSGIDNARSDGFDLSGQTAKLRYTLEASEGEVAFLAVYLLPDPPATESSFMLPDVITAGTGEGEKLIARPAGRYLLNVQSVSGRWSIAVAEAR